MTRTMPRESRCAAAALLTLLMLAACGGGSNVPSSSTTSPPTQVQTTTPTNVVATPWPHTALVSFDAPTETAGRSITNYVVTGTKVNFVTGTGVQSPIMVQGINGVWDPSVATAFQVVANYSDGTSSSPSPASSAVTQTGGAGPSTSPNVYVNGSFYWEGDFDFGGSATYADTSGDPQSDAAGPGPMDIMWNSGSNGGGWQPYAPTGYYDTSAYNYLEFDVKPTTSNKTWLVYFEKYGDIGVGAQVMVPSDSQGTYGPDPVAGEWTTYKIPLKNLNVGPQTSNPIVLKFAICDGVPISNSVFFINNVKFTIN